MDTLSDPQQKYRIMLQFNQYCKKVLMNAMRDCLRSYKRQAEKETSFSNLTPETLLSLSKWDNYFSDEYYLDAQGIKAVIQDALIFEALSNLSSRKRDVILLAYFLGISDTNIAKCYNMSRRMVGYYRAKALQELKQYLEENDDTE